jgi:ABC-type multidrug transport system ATPase subunit/pSer/pThr/pTyr-binding forkhead associated (FHA) protein/ABC-type multidrug transport system permease subunit
VSASPTPAANQEPLCPRCHVPVRTSARFCPSCGYDLLQQPAPAAQPAAAKPAKPPAVVRVSPYGGAPQPAVPVGGPAPGGMSPASPPPSPRTQMLSDTTGITGLVVRWMGGSTQNYPISKPTLSVGRAPDNDIVINHPAVSGHHLTITVAGEEASLTDLNSTNGTQLNGQRIPPNTPRPAHGGDVMRMGDLNGNWVSLALEGAGGEAIRTLSLGKLDLSNMTTVLIGRDPNCYLPLNHPMVSFHHAQIFKQDHGLAIRDLNSTNGTFVNGKRIAVAPLSSGDEIQLGPFKLAYDAQAQSLAQSMRLGHRIDALQLGREVAKKRLILNDVSMTINPGEFVALVGGSGAGKSTLMKAMNGYEPANHGQILLDGEPLYAKLDLYRTQMGYVPQDDIIHRALPVRTALYYAAKLRLPDARPAEINARIQDALRAVEMSEHAEKPVRILSGGQRKRVSIAVELLSRPTLFYLDEPTSGLDPGLEKKMMYDLNRLADEGRTVVLVTHATANIEQCDHVAFLSWGRLSFYGPPDEALTFFGVRDFSDIYLKLSQEIDPAHGKPVPPELQNYYRPGASGKMVAGVLWADAYRNSPQFQKYVADRQSRLRMAGGGMQGTAPPTRRSKDSFIRQTVILARRQFDLIRFDWRTLFILLALMPMLGALFAMVNNEEALVGRAGTTSQIEANMTKELEKGGLILDEKADYLPSVDAELLLAMMALALTQAGTFSAAYEIVKERAIFKRERAVNLKVPSYVFSKMFILGLFAIFQVVAFMLVIAAKVDMGFKGAIFEIGFVELFISLYLAVLASIAFGLFISAIVPSQDVVLYAILAQLFVQIVLSGTMFPLDNNPASLVAPGYWATLSAGSTVDIPGLNEEGRSCSVQEIPNMQTGAKELKVICSEVKQDLKLPYEHTEENVLFTWMGLLAHMFIWLILTMFVVARQKLD